MKSHRFSKESQLLQVEGGNSLLQKGSAGPGVAQIQNVLRNIGNQMPRSFANGTPDGLFGSETDQIVKLFQKERRLKADGIVGRLTMAELDGLLVEQPCFDSACTSVYGARIMSKSTGALNRRAVFYT